METYCAFNMERLGMPTCLRPAATICSTNRTITPLPANRRAIEGFNVRFLRKLALLTSILLRLLALRCQKHSIGFTRSLEGMMEYSWRWLGQSTRVLITRLLSLQLHLASQNKLGMTSDR